MTDTTEPPDVQLAEPSKPTSEGFPAPFDSVLEFIRGESRSEKLMKVRQFIEDSLRVRGQTGQNVVNAVFLQRQRKPFASADDRDKWLSGFTRWWRGRVSRVRQGAAQRRWRQSA